MGKNGLTGKVDPKATALGFLNIKLGSKSLRALSKEEVHAAFIKQLPLPVVELLAGESEAPPVLISPLFLT